MRKSTFNYIKDILADYPKIDTYIKKREDELRYPYRESDLNRDIKGTKASYDSQDNLMITIEQDLKLESLKRNKKVISALMEEVDEDTRIIVEELYFKKWPRYTLKSLVSNEVVSCGKNKAYELRDKFFLEIAKDLELNF